MPFDCRGEEELDWFRQQLAEVYLPDPREPGDDRVWTRPEDLPDDQLAYASPRFLANYPSNERLEAPGFEAEFDERQPSVRFTSGESGNPDRLGFLLQRLLAAFRPGESFWFCWSTISDEQRLGAFAGGLVFVTPESRTTTDVRSWAAGLERRHELVAGAPWRDDPRCPRASWRLEIQQGRTQLGYWDWAEERLARHAEQLRPVGARGSASTRSAVPTP